MTTASNWGQVVLELGEMDKPSTASANLLRAGGVDMSGTVPENEKSKRELFIGTVPSLGASRSNLVLENLPFYQVQRRQCPGWC